MTGQLSLLARTVCEFLLSRSAPYRPAIDKVNFRLDDFHVDPEGFREIGRLIRRGDVEVNESDREGHGAGAVYTAALDSISVTGNFDLHNSVSNQATIIHECTHALMDFHHYETSDLVQEVAAYIAGGLYAKARFARFGTSRPEEQAIFDAAQEIVVQRVMIAHPGIQLRMSDPLVNDLASAIRGASSIYPNVDTVHPSDGIESELINPWYEPRHRS